MSVFDCAQVCRRGASSKTHQEKQRIASIHSFGVAVSPQMIAEQNPRSESEALFVPPCLSQGGRSGTIKGRMPQEIDRSITIRGIIGKDSDTAIASLLGFCSSLTDWLVWLSVVSFTGSSPYKSAGRKPAQRPWDDGGAPSAPA